MLQKKTVSVVVPAYNEESQIKMVIDTMPDFVDRIIIVNDFSKDQTEKVVKECVQTCKKIKIEEHIKIEKTIYNRAELLIEQADKEEIKFFTPFQIVNDNKEDRVVLINHLKNGGVGAAIATGYKWCKDNNIDCTAVMAGDGQMDPNELESICLPVVQDGIDYVKGNRLIHRSASLVIPPIRFFGNSILSILTKLASGYWHVSDTQTGYTSISLAALKAIPLYKIYKSYGMPNDMLVKLNIAFCTLREIEIKPIYNVGEQSKMKISKVIPTVSWLLVKSFFKRLWQKYLFRDFHPLFILYHFSFFLIALSIPYGIKIFNAWWVGNNASQLSALVFMFLAISGFQSFLFAMWMDIQDNERLYK